MGLSSQEKDILKEIGNIGAGNASKALSDMTDQKIEVGFPTVKIEELKAIEDIVDQEGNQMMAVWLDVDLKEDEGGSMGRLLLLMDQTSGKKLASYLMNGEIAEAEMDEMAESSLKEAGNILSGAALTAITDFAGMQLMEGIPNLYRSDLNGIMDEIVLNISSLEDQALIFRTKFSLKEEIEAYFLFVFNDGGKKKILENLK